MTLVSDRTFCAPTQSLPPSLGLAGAGCRQNLRVSALQSVSLCAGRGWLQLDARLSVEKAQKKPERLLAVNAWLPGTAKCCLDTSGKAHLRLELPLSFPEDDGEQRLQPALDCMRQALRVVEQGEAGSDTGDAGEAPPTNAPDVKALCLEAGWPIIERAPGRWAVELEGVPSFSQAEIVMQGETLHLAVFLAEWKTLPESCSEAIAHLLLTASGAFRMIRAALQPADGMQRALLLTRLPVTDVETDLLHALRALSVGAAATLQEVEALRNPAIAQEYQAMAIPGLR
ncbi:MAG TPA: hypothetical protein VKT32_03885 [Chthonomonadaceae bacterium]|nr:hypothetical protein [Chthonomonadaceae bacterium]